jgi:hypothetical protein
MERIVATKNKSLQHESERAITRAQTLATQQYSTENVCTPCLAPTANSCLVLAYETKQDCCLFAVLA